MIRLGRIACFLLGMGLTNLLVLGACFPVRTSTVLLAYGILTVWFLLFNIMPLWRKGNFTRLGVMLGGEVLITVAILSFIPNLILTVWIGIRMILPIGLYILHIILWVILTAVLLINGCMRIFATSVQLGIKWRILLFFFWWFPLLNCYLLWKVCRIVRDEYVVEMEKAALNAIRQSTEICQTKYPIVLVHGVFFRDRKFFNYWGRIPGELIRNGATVFYGQQQSAASHETAGLELRDRIIQIVQQTGCGKVNIIAHSKGGLESRCAISRMGLAPYVASLTTINTPHHGCAFADWLLKRIPKGISSFIAKRYNGALRKLGDGSPDFMAAVCDLTKERCEAFNQITPDAPGILYQSVGSRMKGWTSAPFPQNLSYLFVKQFHRENDGLVGVDAMKWGDSFRMLTTSGRRGISHGDMIDLNRQNFHGFDVREFYVELAGDLKQRGY